MTVALGIGWWIGWALALLVVLLAASLLFIIIELGRRIVRQADATTEALDGAREHTTPLFDVTRTNLAIDRITRGLRAVRTGDPGEPAEETDPIAEARGPVGALRRMWEERKE